MMRGGYVIYVSCRRLYFSSLVGSFVAKKLNLHHKVYHKVHTEIRFVAGESS